MSEETLRVVVRRSESQGQGVLVLDLAAADGGELPPFEAGAHVDLHLGEGLVRQYSLCGDPADRRVYRLGILRDPKSRGGSIAAHERLTEGAVVDIGVPRNLFPLEGGARRSILVGGGIGVTPMIAMAHALAAGGRPSNCTTAGAAVHPAPSWASSRRRRSARRCTPTLTTARWNNASTWSRC